MTFGEAAKRYIASHEKGWKNAKHAQQWQRSLDMYATPVLGKMPVRDISLAMVLKVLEPIWASKTETATRLRGRIESIIDWAIARGYRTDSNPARWKGLLDKLLADTVEYTRQRSQFGQPIASFQVLQHRMVDMLIELEQSVAAQYLAILSLDDPPVQRAAAVSAAKVTIARAARFIGQNAVQLHGGMGMTEELAIGHYFKRLTAIEYEFGTSDAHLDRFARVTAAEQ